jgi:desampylase
MRISTMALKSILAHVWAEYPAECCGLLVGQGGEVAQAETVRNLCADERWDRFEIDPVDHVRVWEAARAAGREIIGCYHSHPDGFAGPSTIDRDHARAFGGPFAYLVVATDGEAAFEVYSGTITAEGEIVSAPLERA